MKLHFFLSLLLYFSLEIYSVYSASACSSYSTSTSCNADTYCKYNTTLSRCKCANSMNSDIIFVIDKTTSSFSTSDWGNIKAFLNRTVQYGSPAGKNRYGIITYNSSVNTTVLSLKSNIGADSVSTYINSMKQAGSSTSANLGAAVSSSLSQFSQYSDSTKKKVLIIIAGGDVSGSPCQYNPRDYDVFTYVIALGTSWVRKDVKCLAMSDSNYRGYISSISTTSSLSSIYQTVELYTCPHQPDIRITEVQPLNTSSSTARYVEFYNLGHALSSANLSFSGLFQGYASSITVSQGQYFVLYGADDYSYPNCSACSCTKSSSNTITTWCSSAVYIGCGTTTSQSWETVKSTCSAQKTYSSLTAWRISLSYSGTTIDNATYKSDGYWPTITTNYAFEKKKKVYNSNYGSSWMQSCRTGGTAGQDPLTTCSTTCTTTMCNLDGGGSSGCAGGACVCSTGYYSYNYNLTCNPFPPPSNCTGTVGSVTNTYEFDLARWDGVHFYSAYYCSAGSTSCSTYQRKTTYGPPVTTTNEKYLLASATIATQYGVSSVYYSTTTTCTASTVSPTGYPTPAPTYSVPSISKCNITLSADKTQYTVYWVKPTYDSNGPSSSTLTGYAIYEDGTRVTSTTTPNVLNYTGSWQQSSAFTVATDYVSVSGLWPSITDTRAKNGSTKCTTYTQSPTSVPTRVPSSVPTKNPTGIPTSQPTPGPTYSNVTVSRCNVTYDSSTSITVSWGTTTFTSTSISSSQATYYLQWTSSGKTQTTSWSNANPPLQYYIGYALPDNIAASMYMYIGWTVNSITGQGPKTACTIKTSSPTAVPTVQPSSVPTSVPTKIPTHLPTDTPTNVPTPCPTYTREKLQYCSVTVGKLDTQGNFSFPLFTVNSSTPDEKHIQYQFAGDSFTSVYVTQSSIARTTDGLHGYQLVQLKNYNKQNASSYFQMYVSYTNLSCAQTYEYGPVSCSVYTAAPSPSPTPAPSAQPTLSPTYGPVTVSFSKSNLDYCQNLACNYSSQTPIELVNEGAVYEFYVQRNYPVYTYNITIVYNFSFVTNEIATEYNFTNEIDPYLYSLNRTTNLTDLVNWKIPNDSYWSNDLSATNTYVGPTYGDIGQWSGTFTFYSTQTTGFLDVDIVKENFVNTVRDYDGEVFLLTLTSCSVNMQNYVGPHDADSSACSITYPSNIFVVIKDANVYTETKTKKTANKSYQSWFWYVIAGIALLLALIGYFVYKWWVNKKMAEAQVTDVQTDIDAVINEQEKGFGNDLGKDNVNFNPLAQPLSHLQKPANNDWTTNTKSNGGELQEKAEVRVEKFNVKQEFGPQAVGRRGGDRI